MEIKGIDNKTYKWNPHLHSGAKKTCSRYHLAARLLLKELYPMDIIHEEVTLPGTKSRMNSKAMYADFYIHSYRLMIEVQGEQHFKFNSHFFSNTMDFRLAQGRDQIKRDWCDINGITLIELPYTETVDEWRNRIENR